MQRETALVCRSRRAFVVGLCVGVQDDTQHAFVTKLSSWSWCVLVQDAASSGWLVLGAAGDAGAQSVQDVHVDRPTIIVLGGRPGTAWGCICAAYAKGIGGHAQHGDREEAHAQQAQREGAHRHDRKAFSSMASSRRGAVGGGWMRA